MGEWYIEKDGEPVAVSASEWSRKRGTVEDWRVAVDEIGDVKVSTVFLGLDHGDGDGPPVLWETMIFGGVHDGDCERYTSRADAEAGHARAVVLVKQESWPKTPDV
jgi:hypothetical protein